MPVSASYSWTQTKEWIELIVPLKGTSPKKLDVMLSESVVKISFLPHLLDLVLDLTVDVPGSRALRRNGSLHLFLKKKYANITWEKLCFEGTRKEMQERRKKALHDLGEAARKNHELTKAKLLEEEKRALRQQVSFYSY